MTISYEEVPYEGHPVPATRPESIAAEAWLRGVRVRHPARARILELGCAEGANVIPLAYHSPDATVVAIDASARHIQIANAQRDELGLDNLTFHHASIAALPDELGDGYDYILCHGVLSWVPEDVRDAIFAVLRERLAPSGVGYVSYNVQPGWSMRGLVRQVLMARTRHIDDPSEKLREARGLLTFMAETPFADHPYGAYMAEEARSTLDHRDPYIAHEYLAEVNHAFTYGEIARLASAHRLRFFAELSPVAHRGIEEQMREVVANITADPIEQEELADVLYGRAFRSSLFVRDDVEITDPLDARDRLLESAAFVTTLRPTAQRPSLTDGDTEEFVDREDVRVSATHPLLKAALLELARSFPLAVPFDDLVRRSLSVLHLRRVKSFDEGVSDEERDALRDDLLQLVSLRHMELRLTQPAFVPKSGGKPRVSTLTRHEARRDDWVTSGFHEPVFVDDAARFLIGLLDGSRDRDELTEQLLANLREHAVQIRDESGAELEGEAAKRGVRLFVDRHLKLFESQGLMER